MEENCHAITGDIRKWLGGGSPEVMTSHEVPVDEARIEGSSGQPVPSEWKPS
jgi:hypothetical protein